MQTNRNLKSCGCHLILVVDEMSDNRIREFQRMVVNAPLVKMSATCSLVRTYPVEIELSNLNSFKQPNPGQRAACLQFGLRPRRMR